ncbi:HAD family hydrolase [Brevibacillus brevis]|uniref:HAD family hydrolase n=1 Tax=Brevibacillus brevis TaxID=1393 RepID=A0ABY9TA71_BREBE|nr:HAD family hydrolase [Brevibacillus brevis]WNC17019.1 HAD family hydrolase [Brevibacillus brevis]
MDVKKTTLLVTDLDGTLLTRNQEISPENQQAIKRLKERGGMFTFATGRTEEAVAPFARQLSLELPMILYNGARISHPLTGAVLYEATLTLPGGLWKELLRAASDGVAVLVYKDGDVYAPERSELLERHEQKDGVRCKPFPPELTGQPITKILLIAELPECLKALEEKIAITGIACETVYSESNYLEILPPRVSKGTALAELVRMLQIQELFVVTVGDNLNDLTMVKEADLGVAVANAHPLLKEAADTVTVHHEEHAIAAVIDRILKEAN